MPTTEETWFPSHLIQKRSLRWHYPEQVQRVVASRERLSAWWHPLRNFLNCFQFNLQAKLKSNKIILVIHRGWRGQTHL